MKSNDEQKKYDRMVFLRMMPFLLILLFIAICQKCYGEEVPIRHSHWIPGWGVHEVWQCPRCGHINYVEDNPCPICAEPRPGKRHGLKQIYIEYNQE